MKKILFLVFLFAASVLQAAEFEVVDQLTVDGATTLKSSVAVITPDTIPSSLWVSTSATTPHLYVATNGNVGIGTAAPATKLHMSSGTLTIDGNVANSIIANGNVGIGTTAIPHGGVGAAMLALDGPDTSGNGPFIQMTTATDDYPLMSLISLAHDNVAILFDGYMDTDFQWKSSDAGSNFKIWKYADKFKIQYVSGIAQGSYAPFQDGIVLNTLGNVGIGTTSPATKLHISSGTLTIDGNVDTSINAVGDVSAARYQINGSTMVAILPGTDSIAYGVYAGTSNITGGNYNIFIGNYAGQSNTTGTKNSFVGNQAGQANTTGGNNSFMGYNAGYSNTTGGNNSFLGYRAGYLNTTGNYNSFLGYAAGYSNTTGANNSFMGYHAGYKNTTGGNNSFMGNLAGYLNTTGQYNSFVGSYAGYNNTTGGNNSVIGYYASRYNQTGSANAIFGNEAGGYDAGGVNSFSSSTIMGYQAGYKLTGSDNIFMGFKSGYNMTTGTGNIVIGYEEDTSGPTANNELNIGGIIYGDLSSGSVGIGTRSPQSLTHLYGADPTLNIQSSGVGVGNFAGIRFKSTINMDANYWNAGIFFERTNEAFNTGGKLHFAMDASDTGTVATTDAKMTILQGGNVGIGTTSPGAKLDLYVNDAGGGSGGMWFTNDNALGTYKYLSIFTGGQTAYGINAWPNAGIIEAKTDGGLVLSALPATSTITFQTSNRTPRMVITGTAGNVGIGTTAPGQRLEVMAPTGSPTTSGTTQNGILRIGGSSGGNGLDIGVLAGSPYSTWMQSGYLNDYELAAYYPISLNPLGGNVGIGTTSPGYKLAVNGSFNATSVYSNGVLLSPGTGSNWTVSGSDVYRSVGNVGIGTTTPQRKLDVSGTGQIAFGADGLSPDSNQGIYWHSSSVYGIWKTAGAWAEPDYQQLNIGFLTGIVIDGGSGYGKSGTVIQPNGGNVGIGTTGPGAKLDVAGHINLGSVSVNAPELRFSGSAVHAKIIMDELSATDGQLWFQTQDAGTLATRMTILDNGNVGIGTTNPGENLHVTRSVAATNAPQGILRLEMQSTGDMADNFGPVVEFRAKDAAMEIANSLGFVGGVRDGSDNSGALMFWTINAGNYTEKVRINKSGNVGIGTTSPATKLHISSGTLTIDGNVDTSINAVGDVSAARYQINGSTMVAILPGTGSMGVGVNAGAVNAGSHNSFLGYYAGNKNITGGNNSFVGYKAGYTNTTGSQNSFLGNGAGLSNTEGANNSFLGYAAGYINTTGQYNSFSWALMRATLTPRGSITLSWALMRATPIPRGLITLFWAMLRATLIPRGIITLSWGFMRAA